MYGHRFYRASSVRKASGSVSKSPVKDKLLKLPSGANYVTDERYTVDTRDHEDHTFNGMMFSVVALPLLPIEVIELKSLAVRGALGPLTVWFTEGPFQDKYEDADSWKRIYKATHSSSFDELVELHFDTPVHLAPGGEVSLYVHSALPNDQGIVYDNQRAEVTHSDRFIQVLPGIAHLSNVPFDSLGHWGWGAWRRRREFVGRLNYGVKYVLWNPEPNTFSLFPKHFQKMCLTLLLCHSRPESPLHMIPLEIVFYLLNMCPYDWPGDMTDAQVSGMKRWKRCEIA